MTKWLGPAAWSKQEARAGDRLPYACHIDASTLRLRDGSLMRCMRLAGLPFETEDDEVLNHCSAVRDVVLRSALNSKAVLYHHLHPPPGRASTSARAPGPLFGATSTGAGRTQLNQRAAVPQRAVPDDRHPPAARQGGPARAAAAGLAASRPTALTGGEALELDSATAALSAALQSYGVRVLGTYENRDWHLFGAARAPVGALQRRDAAGADAAVPSRTSASTSLIRASASASTRWKCAGRRAAASPASSASRNIPTRAAPGLLDTLLRVPSRAGDHRELRADRAPDGARADRPRPSPPASADEGAATERAEMLAARDARGRGAD